MKNSSSPKPTHRRVAAPSQSIPISGTSRSHSELELAQAELLADYQENQMYERIMSGILRRCDRTGTCHPKTITSLENIMRTKMLDHGCVSEHHKRSFFRKLLSTREHHKRSHADGDCVIGDKCEFIHSLPVREVTRHKVSSTSLCSSSGLENETLDSSMSSLSCFSTTQIGSDSGWEADHDVESGIFELEL